MNNELFQQARAAYGAKDFQGALGLFTQCLQMDGGNLAPGEQGLLYHQIGNCLIKLGDGNGAINAYSQATADASYDALGSVHFNLGTAYAKLRDYEDAVKQFEAAVSDGKYDTPYKAYNAMGNALLKLGKSAEAGVAFREAALDEGNPDPTKSLLNLGVCFMTLDRPADAVPTYESALQFDMKQETRNKLYANLGQAYVACGQMQKAVTAFEQAIADKTYFLSDSASVDYQRAIGQVAQGTAEVTQVIAPLAADTSGLDVAADGSGMYVDQDPYASDQPDPYYYADPYAGGDAYGATPGEDRFFNASDEELEQWSKGLAKQERKRRNVGLKILIVIVLLVLVAFGGSIYLYTQGYGYPTQEAVVQQLFSDPDAAATTVFAKNVDESSAQTMLEPVVKDSSVTIDGVNKTMSESTAYATAKTSEGGTVQYKISLVRDMIGWKVSNVELYFTSQN